MMTVKVTELDIGYKEDLRVTLK